MAFIVGGQYNKPMKKNLIPGIAILVVIVALGVVAFRFRSSLPFLKDSSLTVPDKKEVTWPGISRGKVLFVSPPYGLAFGGPSGADLSAFGDVIDGQLLVRNYKVSPNSKQLVFSTMPRISSASAQPNFYTAFLDGTNLKKLDLSEYVKSDVVISDFIWGTDSKSLIFVILTPSKTVAVTNRFLRYDLENGSVIELYEELARSVIPHLYNPTSNQLIFSTESSSYSVDLATKIKTVSPAIFSKQLNGDGSVLASVSKFVISLYKAEELSLKNPVKIDFSDLGDTFFVNLISWSSRCDFLVISFVDPVSNKNISRIYNKSGEKISTVDFYVQEGSVFSSDNSSLLAVRFAGKSDAGFYQTTWQEFDVSTGKSLTSPITTTDLSFAVYWF